jgi:hypothetical protein
MFDRFIDIITQEIVNPLITLLALAAFIVFLWGMVEFIRGAGNDESRAKGKLHMVWGIAGLVLVFAARGIVEFMANLVGANEYLPK